MQIAFRFPLRSYFEITESVQKSRPVFAKPPMQGDENVISGHRDKGKDINMEENKYIYADQLDKATGGVPDERCDNLLRAIRNAKIL